MVINLFNEWKEAYLKRDDFPTEAERYQKQNESEASKELLSSEALLRTSSVPSSPSVHVSEYVDSIC
uniref:Uncharacterized protein n=1 Tax=Quercus lobata TaxID=97700 RepID=A0A7N2MWQ9_QUELO